MITQAMPTLLLYGIVLITSVDAWATRASTTLTSQHGRSSRCHDTKHFCQQDDLVSPLEDLILPLEEDELEGEGVQSLPRGTADLPLEDLILPLEEDELEGEGVQSLPRGTAEDLFIVQQFLIPGRSIWRLPTWMRVP
jgi:hypothetical protein